MKEFPIFVFVLLALSACGDDSSSTSSNHVSTNNQTTEQGTPESEACEHLSQGPFQDITATSASDGELVNAAYDHTRVNIALTDVEGGRGGYTSFEAEGSGDFYFFLSADVPMKILDGSGAEVAFESSTVGSDLCTDIGATHVAELSVGTYILEFGPTTETEVGLVYEWSGAAHGHP